MPPPEASAGLRPAGMAAALGTSRWAGGQDKQLDCLLCVAVDKHCWQPALPHQGMLQEMQSPPSQAS